MTLGSVDGSVVVVRSGSVAVAMVMVDRDVCVCLCVHTLHWWIPMCTKAKYYNTMINRVWVQTL